MPGLNNKSTSHRRLSRFVDWIATPEDREEKIREQADEIRGRIRGKAEADGLTVRSTPWAGSYAKRTGLRRHYQGHAEVEGQDVDLPFVVSPKTRDGEELTELLSRFERYARESYPQTTCSRTRCSVRLEFAAKKVSYDLVPMLAVPGADDEQILLSADGQRRKTSVQKHIEFVKKRTRKSNDQPGRVKFNECVRLVKWWREFRQDESHLLADVPTIVLELLCAKAFDDLGVEETYTATLNGWFGRMASLVRRRVRIGFIDFTSAPLANGTDARWAVIDPVNPENNVLPAAWNDMHLDELSEWFETARDRWADLVAHELAGDDGASLKVLVDIFGTPFKHHTNLNDQ
jgi:hypothetical protein